MISDSQESLFLKVYHFEKELSNPLKWTVQFHPWNPTFTNSVRSFRHSDLNHRWQCLMVSFIPK